MIFYFLDTSAFVKIYSLEPGSERVRNIVRSATAPTPSAGILVCDLVLPETIAALTQLLARGKITRRTHGIAVEKVNAHLLNDPSPFVIVKASGVMRQAGELARIHGLRGVDAVHLATAIAARNASPAGIETWFVSADKDQCRGALAEGFSVLRPDTSEAMRPQPKSPPATC